MIAHRGASSIAPENTLLAFRLAIEASAEMIETDAHLARDGEVVLIHDADLRRTTSCGGSVADLRASDLASCDAGYWFTQLGGHRHPFRGLGLVVPRLSELLRLAESLNPAVIINVEIKNMPDEMDYDPTNRLARRLVNLLTGINSLDRVLVSSFNADAIDCVKELESDIRTAYLSGPRADLHARTAYARARGHIAIHPHHSSLGHGDGARRIVNVMHEAGLEVNVWTVNDPQRMLEMAAAGVDGIITDDPGQLRQLLEREAAST
ncbi:MAG: glycerophosphoryl diester phosphodiesterase [Chloroflexota bacterium]|nr:glycerophosphoryl diester phosphodiesterase [Chloroflexota bacterium]